MTLLGHLSLWLAFLVGLWGAITGFVGGAQGRADLQRSARHATFALFAALAVAVVSLEVAIFRHDFSLEYVAAYTSRNLPTFYLWSALYAGQKGSLLFWATVLSLFAALAQLLTSRRHRVYLIQDNASYHKKPEVLEFFAKHRRQIEVFLLPSYSPDFNAAERLWHYTRMHSTHNRYFDRPEALCQSLFTTFSEIQRHPENIHGLLTPFF